jgi:peptide/nickel transport system permease protein
MFRHIIRRLIQAIPTLFGVTILSYLIIAAAPGGAAKLMSFNGGEPKKGSEINTNREIARLGLNDPWPVQYLVWLTGNDWMHAAGLKNLDLDNDGTADKSALRYGILRFDFGRSFKYKREVKDLIGERILATLELGVSALAVSLALGIPIGILAAIWRGGFFDNSSRIMAVVGSAVPSFWFGLLLLSFFGLTLGIKWARGDRCDLDANLRGCPPIYMRLEYLIMPTIVLSYGSIAGYSRYMRTAMLDTINSDFIRTARAKGLPARAVWFKHAARNALIPLATFLGPALVGILGGAAITETIFSWPGIGKFLVDAVSGRDYPVVMASVLISAVLTVIAYLISDIAYAVFDPRIRF